MKAKQILPVTQNRIDPSFSKNDLYTKGTGARAQEPMSVGNPAFPLKSANAPKPRILIVHEDDSVAKEMELVLFREGFELDRVKTMAAGCESAKSGRFQVVVSAPVLSDGTWKRLIDIENHYGPGFVVMLVATSFDLNEWGEALEDGAFDVLDSLHELPRVGEIARRALWAAYLKGAGPRPEEPAPMRVA
jgi:DNA-binding NtrC family response regulator